MAAAASSVDLRHIDATALPDRLWLATVGRWYLNVSVLVLLAVGYFACAIGSAARRLNRPAS